MASESNTADDKARAARADSIADGHKLNKDLTAAHDARTKGNRTEAIHLTTKAGSRQTDRREGRRR